MATMAESNVPLMASSDDESSSTESPLKMKAVASMGIGGHSTILLGDDGLKGVNSVARANVSIRMGFLRKVFGILAVQLTVTALVSAFVLMYPGAKGIVQGWSFLLTGGFFVSIGLLIAMMIKRHDYPTNFVLLGMWTFSQAYTIATVVTFYDVDVVVTALVLTAVVTIALFVYALQTTKDWTASGAALFSALIILVVGGLLQIILMSPMLDMAMAVGGAFLFSMYIIYDVQMMLKILSPEEYILATINLYLDIVNLFLHILRIVAAAQRN